MWFDLTVSAEEQWKGREQWPSCGSACCIDQSERLDTSLPPIWLPEKDTVQSKQHTFLNLRWKLWTLILSWTQSFEGFQSPLVLLIVLFAIPSLYILLTRDIIFWPDVWSEWMFETLTSCCLRAPGRSVDEECSKSAKKGCFSPATKASTMPLALSNPSHVPHL